MSIIKLLLGTDYIIEIFDVNTGNTPTTMGKVFYCTKIDKFACEWACKKIQTVSLIFMILIMKNSKY